MNPQGSGKKMKIDIFSVTDEPKSSSIISKEEIETLIQFLYVSPESVSVRLKKDKEGGLLLNVKITVKRKSTIQKEMTIPADEDLIQAVIYGLYGNLSDLEKFCESEHKVQNCQDADTVKLETFYALLDSPFKLYLKDELICNEEHYITASFRIAYKKMFNICLKKTQDVADKIQSLIAKEDIA